MVIWSEDGHAASAASIVVTDRPFQGDRVVHRMEPACCLDDDSVEAFRRRMIDPLPDQLNPLYYAVRTGMASWVASPSTSIVKVMPCSRRRRTVAIASWTLVPVMNRLAIR